MASKVRSHTLARVLLGVVRSNKLLSVLLVVVIVADILLALVPPLVLERVVNQLTAGEEVALALAFLYFGALAAAGIADSLKSGIVTTAGQKVTHGLRSALTQKIDRLPASYFTGHSSGALSSLFVNDVDTVRALFDEGVVSMVVDACKVVSIVAVIFTRSLGLGVLLVLVIPLLFLLTRAFQRRMLAAQLANRASVADMNARVPETLRCIRTIRTLGRERYMEERYDKCVGECFRSMEHVNLYDSVYSPIVVSCGSLVIAAMMVLASMGGGMQEFFGMSVGTAAAVIAYVGKVFEPLGAIGMEIESIQQAVAGVRRVREYLDEPEREAPVAPDGRIDDGVAVALKNVAFGYDMTHQVLDGLELELVHGETVTLEGRTGAGKSTVFKLIMGDYPPDRGSVEVWGIPAHSLPEARKRRLVGHVDQSFRSVPGSVLEQVSLHDPDVDEDSVRAAIKLVGLDRAVEALPQGYDTPFAEGLFSQGQLQLLSIARAVAADPRLLLLDEITANLDSGTERQVMDALARAGEGRTVLSISHRLYEQAGRGRLVHIGR